jgi:hypothetical protein
MTKWYLRLLSVLALALLVLANVAPALAASSLSQLTVENKTSKRVDIVLTGPRELTIYANPGRTTVELLPGSYRYKYTACGQEFTGVLKAKSGKVKLKIAACKTARIQIINRGYTSLFLQLFGPENYTITVAPNTTDRLTVLRGDYRYTGSWCGGTKSGSISAKSKSYRWMFWCY